jgi:hypothetical protein
MTLQSKIYYVIDQRIGQQSDKETMNLIQTTYFQPVVASKEEIGSINRKTYSTLSNKSSLKYMHRD